MKKRLFGILLSFALMMGMMPVLGVSQTAYASEVWSTDQTINSDKEINDGVVVTENVTVTIAENATLTVNGGISAAGKTLTVEGKGNLKVTGSKGDAGAPGSPGGAGGAGGNGIVAGNLIINGAKVNIDGGRGGHGGPGFDADVNGGDGGNGGEGGAGVEGTVTVNSGSITVNGGDGGEGDIGGAGGAGGTGGDGGNGGLGVEGTVTVSIGSATVTGGAGGSGEWGPGGEGSAGNNGIAASGALSGQTVKESNDSENWTDVSGTTSTKRYVKVEGIVGYPLWVSGVQVTELNKGDVLKEDTKNKGKVSYDPDTHTLTLDDANITKGYNDAGAVYGIYCKDESLIIESPSGSDNKIIGDQQFDTGIRAANADITFSGEGNLTAEGNVEGILAYSITIDGSNVTAASDELAAISSWTDMVINSGEVTATGGNAGIYSKDGSVIIKGGKVTAAGNDKAVDGTVKNHIAGTGWTDKAGTQGKEAIDVDTAGRTLSYMKVRFPAEVEKVTVKFDSAGGSPVASQTIAAGEKAKKPADPTRSGYTFEGWYLGSTAFDFDSAVKKNITLTAHWKKVPQSTITYDLNGGTLNGETGKVAVKVNNGTVITLPEPTRDGYTFDYWEGSRYNAGDKYTVTGDHTFKAVWKTGAGGNGSKGGSSKGAKTGDDNTLGAWIVLLIAALTGTTGMAFARKRK